jgi:uncharacterized repeat protein (TIGR01451 family)
MRRLLSGLLLAAVPVAAHAAGEFTLTQSSYMQKEVVDALGHRKVLLVEPKLVVPGTRILYVFNYRNNGQKPATGVVFTDPIPTSISFLGTDDVNAVVSTDSGVTWGPLAQARVKTATGALRPALPSDVTHIRWAFRAPVMPGVSGKLSFRGIVK